MCNVLSLMGGYLEGSGASAGVGHTRIMRSWVAKCTLVSAGGVPGAGSVRKANPAANPAAPRPMPTSQGREDEAVPPLVACSWLGGTLLLCRSWRPIRTNLRDGAMHVAAVLDVRPSKPRPAAGTVTMISDRFGLAGWKHHACRKRI